MRIDLSEHADLLRGVAETEETSDGVRCSRLPGNAAAIYGSEGAPADSVRATSGVRIALVTDSRQIDLRLARGSVFNEDGAAVDILVDRAECHCFQSDEDAEDFVVSLELDPTEGDEGHEVEIYLPHLSEVLIRDFELSDGSLFRPSYVGDERILFFGDAVTQGVDSSSPFRTYAALVAAELRTDFMNWGVSGAPLEPELAEYAMTCEWQSAVLACGTNDYREARPLAEFETDLEKTLSLLQDRNGARIAVVSGWPVPSYEKVCNAAGAIPADYRRACEKIVARFPGVGVIDGTGIYGKGRKVFAEDRLHPSDFGMTFIAEAIHKKLVSCGVSA